jgi:P-type Ca2+ transporter type 2C
LALRAADLGVAMGVRGTDLAKQGAGSVLAHDRLATVVAEVVEPGPAPPLSPCRA